MKINKNELLKALEIVKPGLSTKENNIAQTTSFAFLDDRVITYNDEISISHPINEMKINGAVQASEFIALLGKIKEDTIELKEKGNEIILKSEFIKAGFTLQAEIKLPLEEIGKIGKWSILPKKFLRLLKMGIGCCSSDLTKPKLNCVHITKKGAIEASDNFRVIRGVTGEKMEIENFLLPVKAAREVIALKAIKISKGNGWVHFINKEKTILSCRIFEEEYMDVKGVFGVKGVTLILPSELKEILLRASSLDVGSMMEEAVDISLTKNQLKIKKTSDTAWFEEKVKIDFSGEDFIFKVTPFLLIDILNETDICRIDENKIEFEGKDWKYLSALRSPSKK